MFIVGGYYIEDEMGLYWFIGTQLPIGMCLGATYSYMYTVAFEMFGSANFSTLYLSLMQSQALAAIIGPLVGWYCLSQFEASGAPTMYWLMYGSAFLNLAAIFMSTITGMQGPISNSTKQEGVMINELFGKVSFHLH